MTATMAEETSRVFIAGLSCMLLSTFVASRFGSALCLDVAKSAALKALNCWKLVGFDRDFGIKAIDM